MNNDKSKAAKAWYVSCSPRSPEKIAPELNLMKEANGKIWSGIYTKSYHRSLGFPNNNFGEKKKEFEKTKHENQLKVAQMLAALEDFKGNTHEKEASFSIRDRVAPMKTYGFLYVNSDNKLVITPAGEMIIKNHRPKEVFLKQFLKWQYPSYQHGKARPHPKKYPSSEFNIFPFVATLSLIYRLNGLTKYEIAIFVLNMRKSCELNQVIDDIKKFRIELANVSGKNPRKKFIADYHFERFASIYKEEYLNGKKIREKKTGDGLPKYIHTKIRNSYDIADASIRYFRYSGLLSSKGNRVIVLKDRIDDVIEILKKEYEIYPYEDPNEFYKYYGDFKLPRLNYEKSDILISKIKQADAKSKEIIKTIQKTNPGTERDLIVFDELNTKSIEDLKDIYYAITQNLILLNRDALVFELQNSKTINEIIIPDLNIFLKKSNEIIDDVANKFIVDKNSVFEYVIWRAMIAIGKANEYQNNFIIDEDLNIVHHAAGNQGDMEIYYDNFIVLVEVTTSAGVTQFNMEKEPVTRHYEKLNETSEKPVYCIFIAKEINENTYKEFFRYNNIKKTKIVPIELKLFIDIIEKQAKLLEENKCMEKEDLKELFDLVLVPDSNVKNHSSWKMKIENVVSEYVAK